MVKVWLFLVIAILSNGVLGRSVRGKRQAGSNMKSGDIRMWTDPLTGNSFPLLFEIPKSRTTTTTTTTTTSRPATTTTSATPSTTINVANTPEVRSCLSKCPVTSEYNPVCGTDNRTYDNPNKLYCAQLCGVNAFLRLRSRCPSTK